jgi:Ca2+-transporting ATPase
VLAAGTLALAALLVQTPPLAARLHLRPLHGDDWALAVAGGALGCLPLALGALPRRPDGPSKREARAASRRRA